MCERDIAKRVWPIFLGKGRDRTKKEKRGGEVIAITRTTVLSFFVISSRFSKKLLKNFELKGLCPFNVQKMDKNEFAEK